MNPKEKAKNLIHKHLNYFGSNKEEVDNEKARISAITTVDEILQDYSGYRVKHYLTLDGAMALSEYWEEVKTELENL